MKREKVEEEVVAGELLLVIGVPRAVLATFSDCYYPTGHFIALKRTAMAALLLCSLIRDLRAFRGERKRVRENKEEMAQEEELPSGVPRGLAEHRSRLSGKEYGCFIGTGHETRYYSTVIVLRVHGSLKVGGRTI